MKKQDWYRRTTWSEEDEADFKTRLSRTRGQRSEYLRIQAWALADTADPRFADPAIRLATRYLQENPKGGSRAQVLCTIARACEAKEDIHGAVDAYRRAIEAESLGGVRCRAYLQFAWFAATRTLSELFPEVLKSMQTLMQPEDLIFPAAQYRYFGALAVISGAFGDLENAKRMATNALAAASKQTGPFKRHPNVGIVSDRDRGAMARLTQLAG